MPWGGLRFVFPCPGQPLGDRAFPAFCLRRGRRGHLVFSWPAPWTAILAVSTDRSPALSRNPRQALGPRTPQRAAPALGLGCSMGGLGGVLGLCSGKDNSWAEGALPLAWPGLFLPTTSEGCSWGLVGPGKPLTSQGLSSTHCGQAGLSQLQARPRWALQPGQQGVWSYGPRLRAPGGTAGTLGTWDMGAPGGTGHLGALRGHLGAPWGHWGHGIWGHLGTWGHLGARGHLGAPWGHWARGSKRGAL